MSRTTRELAASRRGAWLTTRLEYDGRAAGRVSTRARPFTASTGAARREDVSGCRVAARLRDGAWLVGFEHWHRLWVYRGGAPLDGRPRRSRHRRVEEAHRTVARAVALLPTAPRGVARSSPNGLLPAGWVATELGEAPLPLVRSAGAFRHGGSPYVTAGSRASYAPLIGNTIRVRLVPPARSLQGGPEAGCSQRSSVR